VDGLLFPEPHGKHLEVALLTEDRVLELLKEEGAIDDDAPNELRRRPVDGGVRRWIKRTEDGQVMLVDEDPDGSAHRKRSYDEASEVNGINDTANKRMAIAERADPI
jgi:hypothetical protein